MGSQARQTLDIEVSGRDICGCVSEQQGKDIVLKSIDAASGGDPGSGIQGGGRLIIGVGGFMQIRERMGDPADQPQLLEKRRKLRPDALFNRDDGGNSAIVLKSQRVLKLLLDEG